MSFVESSRFSTGTSLKHYLLTEEIGQGGMGLVYKAFDTILERPVAIKVISTSWTPDAAYIERFYREARAAARLSHPNIVTIHEVGEFEGEPYIVMEYIEGQMLKTALAGRVAPFSADEIIRIASQALAALQAAHQNRILHLDIKSENIMMTLTGLIKVLDFGIARFSDLEESFTGTSEIAGTAEYISPEQALGETVDARSDLYSLGIVLYEMLTGAVPFTDGSAIDIIMRHINEDPPSPLAQRSDAPPGLVALIMKAIAKNPSERYASATDMLSALHQCTAESTVATVKGKIRSIEAVDVLKPFKRAAAVFFCELIGRDDELATLRAAFDRAYDGQGQVVALAGEAGVGKSRLAAELQTYAAERGARNLKGAGYHRDTPAPFFPFIDAIRDYFRQASQLERQRLISFIEREAPDPQALASLIGFQLHATAAQLIDTDTGLIFEAEAAQSRLFYTITRVLQEMAQGRPLTLLLDDFHWADTASLQLFHYLAVEIQQYPILIILTYRSEELEPTDTPQRLSLTELLRRMNREHLCDKIELNRLAPEAVTRLLERVLKSPSLSQELCAIIFQETEGNPFFIQETLKWLRDKGVLAERRGRWHLTQHPTQVEIPERVYDILIRRLDWLTEDQREILQAAAVIGEYFNTELLAQVLDLNKIKLLRILHNLERTHQLIVSGDGGYRFDHTKIRGVLYEELSPDLRQAYHGMIAESLETLPDKPAGELATHRYLAGDLNRAIPDLMRAGTEAERLFALTEASRHYECALEAMNRTKAPQDHTWTDLLLRSGRVQYQLGDWNTALERFERMLTAETALQSDPVMKAEALLQIGRIKRRQGAWDEALETYGRSLSLFQEAENPYGAARVYMNYGVVFFEKSDWEQAASYYQNGLTIAEQIANQGLQADIHVSLGAIASSKGKIDAAITHYTASRQLYETLGNPYGLAKVYNNLGMTYEDHEDWGQALAQYEKALEICQKIGSLGVLTLVYLNSANMAVKLQELEKAEDLCYRALDLLSDLGDQPGIAEVYKIYGMIYTLQESWDQAVFYLEQSKTLFEMLDNPMGIGEVCREMGVLYARRGEPGQAIRQLEEARAVFERIQAQGDVDDVNEKLASLV